MDLLVYLSLAAVGLMVGALIGFITKAKMDSFLIGFIAGSALTYVVIFAIMRHNKPESLQQQPARQLATHQPAPETSARREVAIDDTQEFPAVQLATPSHLSKSDWRQQQLDATRQLAAATEESNRLQLLAIEREQEAARLRQAMLKDTTERWNKHPHWKFFAKRAPRILLCWVISLGIVIGLNLLLHENRHWIIIATVLLYLFSAWYTLRRVYKWKNLRLLIRGYRLYIKEPRNPWLLLFGTTQEVRVDKIDSIDEEITPLETFFRRSRFFNCRTLKINTSIPEVPGESPTNPNDKFRYLTDVVDAKQLKLLLNQLGDEFLGQQTTAHKAT